MAPPDPLDDLREHLRATQEAAARIAAQVPTQGWASAQQRDATAADVQALAAVLQMLRELVPEDLWEQIREVLRRLLLLLRAILDLVVDRLSAADGGAGPDGPGRGAGPQVQDIPIA
jgi:hypothetical protein